MTLRYTPQQIVDELIDQGRAGALAGTSRWPRVRLGEVARVINGAPFRSTLFNVDGVGLPLIRIRDVGSGQPSTWYSGEWEKTHLVRRGDLLVGMDGDFKTAHWGGEDALLNQRVCRLDIFDTRFDGRFFFHALQPYLDAIWAATSSTTVKHLSSKSVADIPLPCPPLQEQRRIVAVLEDHLSRLDAADAYLTAVERRAEGLLAASLRHLVDRSEDDGELRRLADVAAWGSGGTPRAGDSRYYARGTLPWAVIGDLDDGPLRQTARSITELGLKESAAKVVPAGSVLVAMYGSIGKLALPEIRLATNQAIAFARPNDDVGRLFLFWYLRSQRSALIAAGKGGTQKNISQTVLKAWPIPVPTRQTQDELVSVVEAAAESRSRIVHEVQRQRNASTALRRALLTAAFTGRLTGRSSDLDVAEELAEAAS